MSGVDQTDALAVVVDAVQLEQATATWPAQGLCRGWGREREWWLKERGKIAKTVTGVVSRPGTGSHNESQSRPPGDTHAEGRVGPCRRATHACLKPYSRSHVSDTPETVHSQSSALMYIILGYLLHFYSTYSSERAFRFSPYQSAPR